MTCTSALSPSLCVEGGEGSVLRGALLFSLFLNHHHLDLKLSGMLHSAQVLCQHDQQPVGQLRQNLCALIILASQWNTDAGLLCLFVMTIVFIHVCLITLSSSWSPSLTSSSLELSVS